MKSWVAIAILVLGAVVVWQLFLRGEEVNIPSGDTTSQTIIIDEQGRVVEPGAEDIMPPSSKGIFKTREIMVTDGVRHSVPLAEIIGGGPAKDGIPPIDEPKFISPSEADEWLSDNEPGISYSDGNAHRFYPYQILVWHELVNDTVNGKRVLISYCPLCLSGFVFDPLVSGERVEFGTSGKLWKSNLVMYDRKTDSLWSQILGEAILGELTGTILNTLPSDQVLYGNWKKQFPNGQVLSKDTGAIRIYGSSPYGSYFSTTNFALSLAGEQDDRLPNDAFVFGVVVGDEAKAYHVEAVKARGVVEDSFAGVDFILRYDKDLDVVRMFKKLADGSEERVNPFSNFWFSWAGIHPETELYK